MKSKERVSKTENKCRVCSQPAAVLKKVNAVLHGRTSYAVLAKWAGSLGCGLSADNLRDHQRRGHVAFAPAPKAVADFERFALAQVDLNRAARLLVSRPAGAVELAAVLGIHPGGAEEVARSLQSRGYNVHLLGGRYSIERTAPPPPPTEPPVLESDGDGFYRIGAIGDTHLGSRHCRLDVLHELYDWYASEGVTDVYHTGNWVDGECRFNKFDLVPEAHGVKGQLDYYARNYPSRPGVTTHYVTGDDHEGWWLQREGIDIGALLQSTCEAAGRFDHDNMGYMEAYVTLRHAVTGAESRMLVSHPGGGSPYAVSYTSQKYVEALQGGEKPAVLLLGHYHKQEAVNIRNVWVLQTACTKDQDSFARKKKIEYRVGGAIVEMRQDPKTGAIHEFTPRMRQWFDRGYSNRKWDI